METIFGVVDRSDYAEAEPRYDIVEMDSGSEQAKRFSWGASCSGWFPIDTFLTRAEAEEFIANRKAQPVAL